MVQAAQDIRSIWPYKQPPNVRILPAPGACGERSIGLRARTRFPLLFCEGPHAAHCHALELSATGVVVQRGRELSEREQRALFKLEMLLPNRSRPVRVLARVARRCAPGVYAMRFVLISDVDRLTLMEHLDDEQLDSLRLLDDVALASNG
jgi:hypothetical protein